MWGYDSEDWRAGVRGVTAANVDANYQQFINDAISDQFNTVCLPGASSYSTHLISNCDNR